MGADGRVRRRTSTRREVAARARRLAEAGVEAIAIVFLHAYANPRHEAEAARDRGADPAAASRRHHLARGGARRSASSSARPPRWPTRISSRWPSSYLELMAAAPRRGRHSRRRSSSCCPAAGSPTWRRPQRAPVRMLESGPAAGAIAAAFFGKDDGNGPRSARASLPYPLASPPAAARKHAGLRHGRTTAKLSLVDGGEPLDRLQLRGRAAAALHRRAAGCRSASPPSS